MLHGCRAPRDGPARGPRPGAPEVGHGTKPQAIHAHEEAQARYRRGLELLPRDPGLSVNLALSLAVIGTYGEAIAVLTPIASLFVSP